MGDHETCPKCGCTFIALDGDEFDNVVVSIELRKDDTPNADVRVMEQSGYDGYGEVRAYGQLTFNQRQRFLRHLNNYACLLLQECKDHYEADRWWIEAGPDEAVRGSEEMETKFDRAMGMLADVVGLMEESRGIDGYHLNGDIALWDDILPGFTEGYNKLKATEW